MQFDPKKLDLFPNQPGVYLMRNRGGAVLYVGKAKNLRTRVKQYFASGGDGRVMVPFLIEKVANIETIVVTSEKEALLLENNLIKEHLPKYNILLKDDKSFVALRINNKASWPMVELIRYRGKPKPGYLYFGPYTSASAARETLDLLHRLFPLRQCSDQEFARRTRPCILYGMKRCSAPCVNKCTPEQYAQDVNRTIKFLRGQDREVLQDLYKEMRVLSDSLEFERASDFYRIIQQIEKTIERQKVDRLQGADGDVIGLYRQGEEATVAILLFRSGRLLGSRTFHFSSLVQEDEELLTSFLLQHYDEKGELPHEIILPIKLSETSQLTEILSEVHERSITIISPQRGDKVAWLNMAKVNAEVSYNKDKDATAIRERTLLEMEERFRLTNYPGKIECFDNSNLSGNDPVSSMVVFVDGQKDSSRYRKYKVKSGTGSDDYAAFYEVLTRRYKRAKDENDFPDLLIVDGGKGHLNIALKVLSELNIITIDVIAVAKEEGRHDRGATEEQVFLPNVKDPLLLKRNSQVLFFLQQIRDEAHRTAITFQRGRRTKQVVRSALDDIPGIGPTKRKKLLQHFGSVKQIAAASEEALCEVSGITRANALTIIEFFSNRSGHRS